MVDWRSGGVCLHWYLCILLYVKLSVVVFEIYSQLEEGVGSVCTCVVVSHRSMVNWGVGLSTLVSVHSPICET